MNEQLMKSLGFEKEVERVHKNFCPCCAKSIKAFRDSLSEKEYRISGMCQDCQDNVFGDSSASCTDCSNPSFEHKQTEYIEKSLQDGNLLFNVTSLELLTYDIDDVPKLLKTSWDLRTTSKSGNVHLYNLVQSELAPKSWAEKACLHFIGGSDARREMWTLNRRLKNEPYAELMCEKPSKDTFQKLKNYEQLGLGYLITWENFTESEKD